MPTGKHFINGIDDPVERGLRCLLRQHQALRLIESDKVLYRQQVPSRKVLLLSGGGSGHEPAHAGYVGEGMLDICVLGDIFASPSASQVLTGLRALKSLSGVLMIVKNYTGDKLNFGLAAEKAKAEGIDVNVVFVGDDVSVSGNDIVGRRGLAGVIWVHKIAGALAATGATLNEVTRIAQCVADNMYTVGVSLDRCSVPRRGKQESLPFDVLEYGMGIHNEPGALRSKVSSLSAIVTRLLSFLPATMSEHTSPIAVMINNLGGLSTLELNVIAEEVMDQLSEAGLDIKRLVVGSFVTSLDGPGVSVTVLRLQPGFEDLIDAKTTAPAWPSQTEHLGSENSVTERLVEKEISEVSTRNRGILLPVNTRVLKNILANIVTTVTKDEPEITKFDTIAGDGDCGETLLKGVRALHEHFARYSAINLDLVKIFQEVATTVETSMGGTSGAIYAIFFSSLANSLSHNLSQEHFATEKSIPNLLSVSQSEALEELYRYTTARRGHKTLMDALIPFVEIFKRTLDFSAAIVEAQNGFEGTRKLQAVLGRASYVGSENFDREGSGGVPDPGALGFVSVLRGIEFGLRGGLPMAN